MKKGCETKKYPYGGVQNSMNQGNPQIDQAASAVPVYGQVYGLAKGGSNLGKSLIKTDQYGNALNPEGKVANDWLTPDHELIMNGFKQDGIKGGLREASGIGKILRTVSTLSGNDKAKPSSKWGQFNQEIGMQPQNGPIMAMGGIAPPNAEVEKQENTLNPDGSTDQYNGPAHSEGGIPTQLDPGTLIFSDRLKMGKKTFAELNKPNNTEKEDKVLEDNKASKLKRITANLMKEAKNKQSLALFKEQEELKAKKLGSYAKRLGIDSDQFAYGGLKKYPGGGFTPTTEDNENTVVPGFEQSPGVGEYGTWASTEQVNDGLYGQQAADWNASVAKGKAEFNPNDFEQPTSNGMGNSNGSNNSAMWGTLALQGASLLAQNAGNFYDLNRAKNVDKETYNRVSPTYLDPTSDLKYNDLQSRKAVQNLKDASGGNSSTYINSRTAINNATQMNNSRISRNYKNANAEIANQGTYYNAGLGDKETIANLMNQAQARNIKSNAYRGIGTSTGQAMTGTYGDIKAQQRDKDVMNIIATRYPEAMNDPALQEYFKKNR